MDSEVNIMKKSNRVLSILISTCMAITMFSSAPAVFAETDADNAAPAAASDQVQAEKTEADDTETSAPTEPTQSTENTEGTGETDTYMISARVQPNESYGTIMVNPSVVQKGKKVTYTVVPEDGKKILSVKLGDKDVEIVDPYGTMTESFIPEEDTNITVNFGDMETYKITTSVNSSSRGSITKTASVRENDSFTVTATPKSGYYVSDLQVDGESLGNQTSYTFENVNADHKVKAVFDKEIKIMLR